MASYDDHLINASLGNTNLDENTTMFAINARDAINSFFK